MRLIKIMKLMITTKQQQRMYDDDDDEKWRKIIMMIADQINKDNWYIDDCYDKDVTVITTDTLTIIPE